MITKRIVGSFCLGVTLLIGACSSAPAPTIESREAPPSRRINSHEVQEGETLYSIAWRYEVDYREMAQINGLSEPYRLARGQRVKIFDDGSRSSRSAVVIQDRSTTINTRPASRPVVIDSGVATASRTTPNALPTATIATQPAVSVAPTNWQWPTKGRITKAFGSDSLTKGIVIDPGADRDVRAASDGTLSLIHI